jgi:CheY-like chemotaxis protein
VFKILYVEDHPAQRDIMAQMLELSGYEVAAACDGVDGVEQAHSWRPDLILMDLRMPRMDGFEAIKVLRSDPETADIPIIAISAWASAKHKERALDAGADEHFTKPVDLNRLLETINRYLNQPKSRSSGFTVAPHPM